MLYKDVKAASDRVNDAYNRHDLEGLASVLAPDYKLYSSMAPGGVQNREQQLGMWAAYWNAFPDMHNQILDEVIEGDKVCVRITITGTFERDFMGIPANGKQITLPVIDIIRYEDGLCKEEWGEFNQFAFLQQVGAIPPAMPA